MKRYRIPIAIALILVPILARTIWYYRGIYWQTLSLATPDYASYTIPQIPVASEAVSSSEGAASKAIVLVDEAHSNMFADSELEYLAHLVQSRGGRMEAASYGSYGSYGSLSLSDQLKYASAFVSICPIKSYSTAEVQLLEEFVQRGGRLLILTDPTRSAVSYDYYGYGSYTSTADVVAANTLLAPYDIRFLDDYLYNMTDYEGNYRNVYFRDFAANGLTKNLNTVVLYAAHSLETNTGTVLIQSSKITKSSRTDADGEYAVAALDAGGSVLAIGDMTFLTEPYNQVDDNPVLIQHLADFLLDAPRVHDLKDFPFVFQRDVAIVLLKDVKLNSSILGPIQSLQQDLSGVGIGSSVSPQPVTGKDLLVLGTYASPGVNKYVDPLDITLPASMYPMGGSSSQIEIPGFGSLSPSGIGLILFIRTDTQTTLALLAGDSDSLTSLMNVIGPYGFSDCVLQGNVAVCGVSGGYGSYTDYWWDNTFGGTDLEPTMEITPSEPDIEG
jgi:hypothetical protein